MLVICDGQYKPGSIWVFLMLLELLEQGEQSDRLSDPNRARSINVLDAPEYILAAGLKRVVASRIRSYEADHLAWLRENGGRTVVTVRQETDIMVSHYQHFSKEKLVLPAWLHAATVGLSKALEVAIYKAVATRPEAADLIISFAELKKDPEKVLATIVETFKLGYTAEQVATAAQRANMRRREYGETFSGMEERPRFSRRNDSMLGDRNLRTITLSLRFARELVNLRLYSRVLISLFHLDVRRSAFQQHCAARPKVLD